MRGWVRHRWIQLRSRLPLQSLSKDGVRGAELIFGARKFVFYTVRSPQMWSTERIGDEDTSGFWVIVAGRAFVAYTEKRKR